MTTKQRIESLRRRVAAFLRRLAQKIDVPVVPVIAPRFQVSRVHEGIREIAYRGNDGAAARRAWEGLVASSAKGKMRFHDGEACRGEVIR